MRFCKVCSYDNDLAIAPIFTVGSLVRLHKGGINMNCQPFTLTCCPKIWCMIYYGTILAGYDTYWHTIDYIVYGNHQMGCDGMHWEQTLAQIPINYKHMIDLALQWLLLVVL